MLKVLVVDDDPRRHRWFTEQARRQGWVITQAWTAGQGVRALEGERFDLVFLDHDLELSDPAWQAYLAGVRIRADLPAVPNGTVVARALTNLRPEKRPRRVHVHSWNSAGGSEIEEILRAAGLRVTRRKYGEFRIERTAGTPTDVVRTI